MNYLIVCVAIALAVVAARLSPESKKERAKPAAKLPTAQVCEATPPPPPPTPGQG